MINLAGHMNDERYLKAFYEKMLDREKLESYLHIINEHWIIRPSADRNKIKYPNYNLDGIQRAWFIAYWNRLPVEKRYPSWLYALQQLHKKYLQRYPNYVFYEKGGGNDGSASDRRYW